MRPEALARLHARCFSTTPRPWTASEFGELLQHPGCFLLTEPEGFLLGRVVAGEAELLTLAVAPEARRQGIARRLLAAFDARAHAAGAETAFLELSAANEAALAAYRGCGWQDAGRRRGYYRDEAGNPVDALVLRLQPGRPPGGAI
jgi:ribosomal-protein-alanine N-acetyltransferase